MLVFRSEDFWNSLLPVLRHVAKYMSGRDSKKLSSDQMSALGTLAVCSCRTDVFRDSAYGRTGLEGGEPASPYRFSLPKTFDKCSTRRSRKRISDMEEAKDAAGAEEEKTRARLCEEGDLLFPKLPALKPVCTYPDRKAEYDGLVQERVDTLDLDANSEDSLELIAMHEDVKMWERRSPNRGTEPYVHGMKYRGGNLPSYVDRDTALKVYLSVYGKHWQLCMKCKSQDPPPKKPRLLEPDSEDEPEQVD